MNASCRGNGLYGQLGHLSEASSATPLPVRACDGLRVIYVSCGAYHTAAIIGNSCARLDHLLACALVRSFACPDGGDELVWMRARTGSWDRAIR